MARFQLVVFDFDGTLVDSRPDIADALNAALAEEGLPPWSEAAVEDMLGDGARQLVERGIAGRLPEARLQGAIDAYGRHYAARRSARTRPFPGVIPGLQALGSVGRAIATNKPGPLARAICDDLGLTSHFQVILGDGDVARRKPDPAMIERAMATVGADRAGTLYVGDGPVDVKSAAAAGVPLCLVAWGYSRGEALPSDFSVERFDQLVELVLGG